MLELIEKTILAGIGTLALTQKKAEELKDDLKDRLNLSEEEGKKLLDKLQGAIKENQAKLEEMAQAEVKKACERVGLVTEEEISKLKKRIDQLEKKLNAQE